jgi:hypothetical protein
MRNLRTENGFCCLGVLCDLLKDHPEVEGYWNTHLSFQLKKGGTPQKGFPGPEVIRIAGIGNDGDRLAGMNDAGMTFTEIANYIETHL